MELCLSQYWSSLGAVGARLRVHFHSLAPDCGRAGLTLHGGDPLARVVVTSHLRAETLDPKAKLTHWQQKLRPTDATIAPLTARDVWMDNRQVYRLTLTYAFEEKQGGDIAPLCPALNGLLYESPFEAQVR